MKTSVPSSSSRVNEKPEVTFFVAANGNDTRSGKLAQPNGAKTDGEFRIIESSCSFLFPDLPFAWPEFKEIPLDEWQKTGFDTHSVFADPMFADPKHDDCRLKPESAALELGFVPIDVTKIGVRQ